MNIDKIADWDVDISVGSKFFMVNNIGVNSDVDSGVGSGYIKWFELENVDEFGYGGGISADKVIKVVRGRVIVGRGDIIFWGFDRCVDYGVDISDGIKLGLDNESRMG